MLKKRVHQIVAFTLFIVIVGAYLIMAVKFPMAYIVATYEDLIGEWIQVFFFAAAMVLSARLAIAGASSRLFFAVLAIACFYVIGEEISWGQRIFNISAPDFFRTHNLQKETNIHNFFVGPYSTPLKRAIEYVVASGLVLFGLFYPLFVRLRWKPASWIEKRGIPSPPLYVWPFFVLSAILELGLLKFNEAEVAEILIPFGLSIFALHYWTVHREHPDDRLSNPEDNPYSRRLAFGILAVFLCVLLLSAASTYASYASPRIRAKIENRLTNGMEKFAGRYRRYNQWGIAARLYHGVDSREPGRTSIQRRLATCYKRRGEKEKADFYLRKALEIDLRRLEAKPKNVSKNISIARTYRMMGDTVKSRQHLNTALEVALERVEKKPDSSAAAYWLGKTYAQKEDHRAALKEFQRAFRLKPHISKYRKAVFRTQSLLGHWRQKEDDVEESEEEGVILAK